MAAKIYEDWFQQWKGDKFFLFIHGHINDRVDVLKPNESVGPTW